MGGKSFIVCAVEGRQAGRQAGKEGNGGRGKIINADSLANRGEKIWKASAVTMCDIVPALAPGERDHKEPSSKLEVLHSFVRFSVCLCLLARPCIRALVTSSSSSSRGLS